METNQDKGVKATEESRIETEEEGEKTEEIKEEAQGVEKSEETEKTLEVAEDATEEEAKLEEPPEEKAVEEETEEITLEEAEADEVLEEKDTDEEEEKLEIEKREVEEEIVEERVYTIPLRRAWISPRKKRTPRAIRLVKAFIQRHMKPEALVMSNEVNERLWSRSIQKPPRKIRVRAVRDTEGTVTLYLAEGD